MEPRQSLKSHNKNLAAQVIKDINQFLEELKLGTLYQCDIFEHTLLRMAGVAEYGSCKTGDRGERISITIGNLISADAEKFLAFLHNNGDKTAVITNSRYEENKKLEYDEEGDVYVIYKPHVSFSISSVEFYKNIFPLFKATIKETKENHPTLLVPYLPKPTTNNPARMFYPSSAPVEPIDQTVNSNNSNSDKVLIFKASK